MFDFTLFCLVGTIIVFLAGIFYMSMSYQNGKDIKARDILAWLLMTAFSWVTMAICVFLLFIYMLTENPVVIKGKKINNK